MGKNGAFYSALDADSEGEEGKFYVWSKAELKLCLGEDFEIFKDYYNINKNVDPIRDLEIIETEILLSDLESIQKRLEKNNKKKLEKDMLNFLESSQKLINQGKKPDELRKEYRQ